MLDDEQLLEGWLALFQGPGFRGQKARDQAIAEMQAAGPDRLFPLLRVKLADPDPEARCLAIQAILWIDAHQGQDLILPLLLDPDAEVRWCAAWCLHDFGDDRAVPALVTMLQNDGDPKNRGAAAYALGGIGSPAAIPALLRTLDGDHQEWDSLGQSPSSQAATALDAMLGAPEIPSDDRDPETLRRRARGLYQQWTSRQEPGGEAYESANPISPNANSSSISEPDVTPWFWELLNSAQRRWQSLCERLEELSKAELRAFRIQSDEAKDYVNPAYWDECRPYLHDGCSESVGEYFAYWVVTQGQVFYNHVRTHPEEIQRHLDQWESGGLEGPVELRWDVEVDRDEYMGYPRLDCIAEDIYEARFGEVLYDACYDLMGNRCCDLNGNPRPDPTPESLEALPPVWEARKATEEER